MSTTYSFLSLLLSYLQTYLIYFLSIFLNCLDVYNRYVLQLKSIETIDISKLKKTGHFKNLFLNFSERDLCLVFLQSHCRKLWEVFSLFLLQENAIICVLKLEVGWGQGIDTQDSRHEIRLVVGSKEVTNAQITRCCLI